MSRQGIFASLVVDPSPPSNTTAGSPSAAEARGLFPNALLVGVASPIRPSSF